MVRDQAHTRGRMCRFFSSWHISKVRVSKWWHPNSETYIEPLCRCRWGLEILVFEVFRGPIPKITFFTSGIHLSELIRICSQQIMKKEPRDRMSRKRLPLKILEFHAFRVASPICRWRKYRTELMLRYESQKISKCLKHFEKKKGISHQTQLQGRCFWTLDISVKVNPNA